MNTANGASREVDAFLPCGDEYDIFCATQLFEGLMKEESVGAESILEYATRGLAATIGIEIVELSRERVVATMPVDARTHQPYGLLHGGASVALAETVASLGAIMNIDQENFRAVGLEINANHVRAKTSGNVRGTAEPIHLGRSTHVWKIEIVDEEGRLVCISRCTVAIVPIGK